VGHYNTWLDYDCRREGSDEGEGEDEDNTNDTNAIDDTPEVDSGNTASGEESETVDDVNESESVIDPPATGSDTPTTNNTNTLSLATQRRRDICP
jgi:hypothetical protein